MKKYYTKKNFIALTLFTTTLLFAFSGSHPTTGTGGYTGAPQDNVCTTCHSPGGGLDGTLEITGLPATIDPSTTYPLTVTITNTVGNASRAGFQMVSLKASLANGGTFAPSAGETNAVVKTIAGKSYIGHEPSKNFDANDEVVFNVDWTSPASATGNLTVYAATIIANGGNGNSNDKFLATNVVTSFASGDPLMGSFSNTIPTSCSDTNDGSATFDVTGGSGNYTFTWDNGESSPTATMLSPGMHSVTVIDDSNASLTENIFIESPDPIVATIVSQDNAQCNGTATGSATLSATGGQGGVYNYDWGNGISGATQTALDAGSYSVSVSDINNCETVITVDIGEPDEISIFTISSSNPLCNGESTGAISVDAVGGAGGFVFNWLTTLGNPNGGNLTDIPAGTYTVEAFDSDGCFNSTSISISDPDVIVNTVNTTDVNCTDGMDGTATANGNGGTGAISYFWSTGESGATVSSLDMGDYSVTASDENGCAVVTDFSIGQPTDPLTAMININTQPNCGNTDGTLTAFAVGGTAGYSFEWSNGESTDVITNLASGSYTVTATDMNGCTSESMITLTDNDGITLAANDVTNNQCFGSSGGSATISASGGDGNYMYSWSSGGTNNTETGLFAGTYIVTVTDGNNCSGEITIEITQPLPILANEVITNIECTGDNNGSIMLSPTGGNGDISISWDNGSTESSIENLAPGEYSATLTDSNDCLEFVSYFVAQPEPLSLNPFSSIPTCVGENDGSVGVNPTGGSGEYEYVWSTGDSTNILMDIPAGNYELTITDSNGCDDVAAFTIDDPAPLNLSAENVSPTCPESADGSITIIPQGGTGEYTYLWQNNEEDSLALNMNLESGEYSVQVTDENGCSIDTLIFLEAPLSIVANITTEDETVSGMNDGTASANPVNGTAPYSYMWSNGDSTAMISDLAPGTYALSITDSLGCTVIEEATINSGDCLITATPIISQISCFGLNDASIILVIEGTTDSVSYEWSNGATTDTLESLGVGSYSVIVTDSAGCSIQLTDIEITEPSEIMATDTIITQESSAGSMDGRIDISFIGGSGDLTITYKDENGNTIEDVDPEKLSAGNYIIEVTDENGCIKSFGPFVIEVLSSTEEEIVSISVFPNPARQILYIQTSNILDNAPELFSLTGSKLSTTTSRKDLEYSIDVSTLHTGVYLLKIVSNGSVEMKKIIVQ